MKNFEKRSIKTETNYFSRNNTIQLKEYIETVKQTIKFFISI